LGVFSQNLKAFSKRPSGCHVLDYQGFDCPNIFGFFGFDCSPNHQKNMIIVVFPPDRIPVI